VHVVPGLAESRRQFLACSHRMPGVTPKHGADDRQANRRRRPAVLESWSHDRVSADIAACGVRWKTRKSSVPRRNP
jgi:hypothetical protein